MTDIVIAPSSTPSATGSAGGNFRDGGLIPNAVITGGVAANEIVCHVEGGLIMRANPLLPWSALNNQTAGPVPLIGPDPEPLDGISTRNAALPNQVGCLSRLENGNIVVPFSNLVGFAMLSPCGAQVAPELDIVNDTAGAGGYGGPTRVVRLTGGEFAIVWDSNTTAGDLQFILFTAAGVAINGSPVTVTTTLSRAGVSPYFSAVALSNGNMAIAWVSSSGGGAIQAQVYNTSGSTVGSLVTIASVVGERIVMEACKAASSSDFLVGFWYVAGSRYNLYRISSAGSSVWGPIVPSAATAPFTFPYSLQGGAGYGKSLDPDQHNRLRELTNGNIIWLLPNPSNYANVYVLNSSGTLIETVDITTVYVAAGETPINAGVCPAIEKTPDGFCIVYGNATTSLTKAGFYDYFGNGLAADVTIDTGGLIGNYTASTNQSGVFYYMAWAGTGVAIARLCCLGPSTFELRFMLCDTSGNLIGEPVTLQPARGAFVGGVSLTGGPDGIVTIVWWSQASLFVASFACARSSILGWAQATVADQGITNILCAGFNTMPSTQVFGGGRAFDQRAQQNAGLPTFGAIGSIGGSTAILGGMS